MQIIRSFGLLLSPEKRDQNINHLSFAVCVIAVGSTFVEEEQNNHDIQNHLTTNDTTADDVATSADDWEAQLRGWLVVMGAGAGLGLGFYALSEL